MDIIVINCTVPSKKLAKDITKVLMKHKLAACVSMIENVRSVFSWEVFRSKDYRNLIDVETGDFVVDIKEISSDMCQSWLDHCAKSG